MARVPRRDVFDPRTVSVFHCLNRCVRRCFLCGDDPLTGRNFDHRKVWLEERIQFLARWFGIDVLNYAILSNHFHIILRNRPDVVETWSDREIAIRWLHLCPPRRKKKAESPPEPSEKQIAALMNKPQRLAELRVRLSDVSWFMKMISEYMARRANREDDIHGRFWEGRFKATKLCDLAALSACAVYVDLNLVRAGLAATPEGSRFTSIRRRIEALRQRPTLDTEETLTASVVDDWLAPLPLDETAAPGPQPNTTGRRCSDKGFLEMSLTEYLELVDWSGRQLAAGKRGSIPQQLAPILERLGIEPENWLTLATDFGRLFHRVAGSCDSVQCERGLQTGHPFHPGRAELLTPNGMAV